MRRWWRRGRRQRECWHHANRYTIKGGLQSYIEVQAHVDGGRRMFVCREDRGGCGKVWFL